jgi:hypothetical protein
MNKAKAIIRDGYNETVFLKGRERIHEEITFDFRPMMPGVVRELTNGFSSKPPRVQSSIMFEALSQHVVKWSLTEANGNPVTLSIENIQRLKNLLLDRMFDVITGYDGGDDPATATTAEEFDAKAFLSEIQKPQGERQDTTPLDILESTKN